MTTGRLIVRISPDDVGSRVSVRSRTHAPEGQPSTTDTIGWLRAWRDGGLEIERRDGQVVRIPEADVLAARVVPPPPSPRPRS